MLVAVYGSLRKGMPNHHIIRRQNLVKEGIVNLPYKMTQYGNSYFPALFKQENIHPIYVEIYDLDEESYRNVEILEGYPDFYDKYKFDMFGLKDIEIYVINNEKPYSEDKHIQDWVEYYNKNIQN